MNQTYVISRFFNPMAGATPRTFKVFYQINSIGTTITLANTNTRQGQLFNAGSSMIGINIRRIAALVRSNAGIPTGNMFFTIRNSADTIITQSDNINVTTLGLLGDFKWVVATLNPTPIPLSGRVLFEYPNGDVSNNIQIARTSANVMANQQSTTFAASYTESSSRTTSFIMWT